MASPDLDLSIKLESSTDELKSSSPSLEILKPQSWVPPSSISAPTETSRHLEDLTRQVIEVFCNQDWDNAVLKKHAISNFQGIIEYCSARTQTLEEHIELHKKIHKANPGYIFDVRSCDVDVDEVRGQATAWAVLTVTGYPLKIQRESMTILWWRRRNGLWRAYKQFGLRGVDWYPVSCKA